MTVELQQEVLAELQSVFNIKFAIDCRRFDMDFSHLGDLLKPYSGQYFHHQDKLLFVHMDADYYDPLLPCGLIPINLIRVFQNLDIPMHAMLFVTNHFGIKREFDLLLAQHHINDRPVIVQTLLSSILMDTSYSSVPVITTQTVAKQALCMMNRPRSHRVAFWNFILDNDLLDKIAVSQNFNV